MLDGDGNAGTYEPSESPAVKLAEAVYEAIKRLNGFLRN